MKRMILFILMGFSMPSMAALISQGKSPLADGVNCDQVKKNELLCLACNIFHEAGNQSVMGKIAVGAVTINRKLSKRFPNSICGVVWDHKEFSWTFDRKSNNTPKNLSWLQSLNIAFGFFVGGDHRPYGTFSDPTNCALYYHGTYIKKPYWVDAEGMIKTTVIEKHVFYYEPKLGCPYENNVIQSSNEEASLPDFE